MKTLVLAAMALTLSACASAAPETPPAPPPPVSEAPTVPVPPAEPEDSCKAAEHQYLIGKNRSEIPVATDPSKVRVACTTCPVTMDFRGDRLNIFYDANTSIVKQVSCG